MATTDKPNLDAAKAAAKYSAALVGACFARLKRQDSVGLLYQAQQEAEIESPSDRAGQASCQNLQQLPESP